MCSMYCISYLAKIDSKNRREIAALRADNKLDVVLIALITKGLCTMFYNFLLFRQLKPYWQKLGTDEIVFQNSIALHCDSIK